MMSSFLKWLGLDIDPNSLNYFPLKGGGSEATLFSFNIGQNAYVLRLLPEQADRPTRKHQIALAIQAGKIGVGPEVYFVDNQLQGMVMQFIPGTTVKSADFEHSDQLGQFAKLLQKLHRSNEKFPIAISPFQRFNRFIRKGKESKITYPSKFDDVKNLMNELEATLKLIPISQTPTHLDLHPLNIMQLHDSYLLVDWVNGGMCDPYFDLATFATFQCLNESKTHLFLTHYFERPPTSSELDRYIITQPIRLFVAAAALLNTSPDSTRLLSYNEALTALILPSMREFSIIEKSVPLWQFGLTLLISGLELADHKNFKQALHIFKSI